MFLSQGEAEQHREILVDAEQNLQNKQGHTLSEMTSDIICNEMLQMTFIRTLASVSNHHAFQQPANTVPHGGWFKSR